MNGRWTTRTLYRMVLYPTFLKRWARFNLNLFPIIMLQGPLALYTCTCLQSSRMPRANTVKVINEAAGTVFQIVKLTSGSDL